MTRITPTVGRVLHFIPTAGYMAGRKLAFGNPTQPLAAVIAYVHSDTMVNLTVWDQNGEQFSVCSVPLVQDGCDMVVGSFFAKWMPYQKGQAAKTESLESQLAGKPAIGIDLAAEQDRCVRVFLEKGAIVKVEGIPLELDHDAVVRVHPANVPLIFLPRTARPAESSE
ncbi:hypothetical protein CDR19_04345 [Ectopseudomonas toyotomiensis]|uniref:Uncharacterized protein n=1 Tax=Ectopseudomonas toyotomiensis TaxID=554344 RepID=A0A1I5R1V5_9GAMM|nr:hypothetical protein [Pseudomonas toyotomiensis]PIA74299.1 hypothetical protein CDR19_04345 [Pseudomonas toyotomiensis]SFP52479.1 hypothetical protein SAMN05216177_103248 [Pseudomonas toyotomiensis]